MGYGLTWDARKKNEIREPDDRGEYWRCTLIEVETRLRMERGIGQNETQAAIQLRRSVKRVTGMTDVTEVMEVTPYAVEVTYPSNQPLLTLITCSGWDNTTWSYRSRTVVRASFSYWRTTGQENTPAGKMSVL
jgi:hypothetical protein